MVTGLFPAHPFLKFLNYKGTETTVGKLDAHSETITDGCHPGPEKEHGLSFISFPPGLSTKQRKR